MPASASRSVYLIDRYWAVSTGRRNTLMKEVAMTTGKRRSSRSTGKALHSLGRPPVARREHRRVFWAAIAAGRSSEDAAVDAGVSPPVGTRWFREAGGMTPSHLAPSAKALSGRFLSFAEREEIALLRAGCRGVREIARHLGRAPSTVSRELRRHAATRSGMRTDPPAVTRLRARVTLNAVSRRPFRESFHRGARRASRASGRHAS